MLNEWHFGGAIGGRPMRASMYATLLQAGIFLQLTPYAALAQDTTEAPAVASTSSWVVQDDIDAPPASVSPVEALCSPIKPGPGANDKFAAHLDPEICAILRDPNFWNSIPHPCAT